MKTAESSTKIENNKKIKDYKKEKDVNKDEERRKEYEKLIDDFINSKSNIVTFPKNLTSFDRFLLHEIADKCNLIHESQGEGKDRVIILRKNNLNTDNEEECNDDSNRNEDIVKGSDDDKDKIKNEITSHSFNESIIDDTEEDKPKDETKGDKYLAAKNFEKKKQKNKKNNKVENKKIENREQTTMEQKPKIVTKKCSICHSEINVCNFELHSIQCEKNLKEKQIKKEINKRKVSVLIFKHRMTCLPIILLNLFYKIFFRICEYSLND